MNSVFVAAIGLAAYALFYRFYSRYIAESVFGIDPQRTTPAISKRDGIDYVPTNRHVLFGHHFTSIAGAAPILGPAIAVIWGWVPALLWVVFGSVLIGAVHDFGCMFVSVRNGGSTIADLTGRIVGPRARFLFLLFVFFLAWIVIAVFAVVIGSLFTDYPETVLPVNFEILIAVVIGLVIYRYKASLLAPSLIALGLLYVMVWVGATYTQDFRLPTLFPPAAEAARGTLTSGPWAEDVALTAGAELEVMIDGDARTMTPAAAQGPAEVARALAAALGPAASCTYDRERQTVTLRSPTSGEDSAIGVSEGELASRLALTPATGAQVVEGRQAYRTGRVQTWVILLLGYAFLASVLPVWVLLQPRDYINSHQLFVGLGAMYLGLVIAHPPMAAPAVNLNPAGGGHWFPLLFITIACGAISGFHGLVASGTTSKQIENEADTRPIGYGGMLGEASLALMALLACTAGFADEAAWHSHYSDWSHASGLGSKLGAFVKGGASFLEGVGLPLAFAKAVIAVIVISFAATTLDTATRIQRFVFQELAGTYSIKPLQNRFLASAIAAFTPLVLVFGTGADGKPYWLDLWPIFGASNQMLGGLCLLVLTFYLIRRGRNYWVVALPTVFLSLMTGYATTINLVGYVKAEKWLLVGLSAFLLALAAWVLLEGVLTLQRIQAEGGEAGEAGQAPGIE